MHNSLPLLDGDSLVPRLSPPPVHVLIICSMQIQRGQKQMKYIIIMDKYMCPVLCILSCITHEFRYHMNECCQVQYVQYVLAWQCCHRRQIRLDIQQKVFLILSLLVAHFTMSVVEGEEYMYLPCSTRREKRPALSPAETVHMYTGDHIVALALDSSASVSFKS